MKISLRTALFTVLGGAVLVALVPAGLALDRQIAAELERKARDDLAVAPMVLKDRNQARAEALSMHAKDLAGTGGLASALSRGDVETAVRLVAGATIPPGEEALLVGGSGEVLAGPAPASELVEATRRGEMPVGYVYEEGLPRAVALAPVMDEEGWRGAAGVAVPVDQVVAATLAGLTRSEVAILGPERQVTATTSEGELALVVADSVAAWAGDDGVHEVTLSASGRHWVTVASLGEVGSVVFSRSAERELAVLPHLRRGVGLAGLVALVLALAVGAVLATTLTGPVRTLARAADRVVEGDFQVPLEGSAITEVDRVGRAFEGMRQALSARLEELARANRELEDRQERLTALQSELIQRDRLVASGRLVAELAHEIRNPVANVRNCLEVIQRRLGDDAESREFADMAIDELLRMHDLAEQMLDLNRPVDPGAGVSDVNEIVRQVTLLFQAGAGAREADWELRVEGPEELAAAIAPDTLKQVLLNLLENAREAMPEGGRMLVRLGSRDSVVTLELLDEGPGISEEDLPRIFDPFFTTKGAVQGVGLGLFVAEGLVRRHGGRISARNREEGPGAHFRIEIPAASPGEAV